MIAQLKRPEAEAPKTSLVKPKIYKIILGGDGGIGKTTLLKVFCGEGYSNQDMTIGFDIFVKDIDINGVKEKLQIWDLSGQDHFRFLLPDYFRGAHGVILGFDMSRRVSFLNLRTWMTILLAKCPEAPIVLIATKSDKGYHPTLSPNLAKDFAKQFNIIEFIEVSAKNNINTEAPFKRLIETIRGSPSESGSITFSPQLTLLEKVKPGESPQLTEGPLNGSTGQCVPKVESSPRGLSGPKPENGLASQSVPKPESVSAEPSVLKQCPHCKSPLREAQIKLKQAGRQTLCTNCLKMI